MVTSNPQPSLIALLRSAVDQLQQYLPNLQRNKSAAKGYIAVMQKCSEPEEGGEYGYLHKGFVMRAIEDACRDARPQSRPEAELPEVTDEMVERARAAYAKARYEDQTCFNSMRAALQAAYGQQCAATRQTVGVPHIPGEFWCGPAGYMKVEDVAQLAISGRTDIWARRQSETDWEVWATTRELGQRVGSTPVEATEVVSKGGADPGNNAVTRPAETSCVEITPEMLDAGFKACEKQYAAEPLDDMVARVNAVYRAMRTAEDVAKFLTATRPAEVGGDGLVVEKWPCDCMTGACLHPAALLRVGPHTLATGTMHHCTTVCDAIRALVAGRSVCPECESRRIRRDAIYRGPAQPGIETEHLADSRSLAEPESELVTIPRELTLSMNEAAEQEFACGNDFHDAWEAAIATYLFEIGHRS